jgi:hypothetical protein
MKLRCHGYGDNPWVLNVITFSGHGYTYRGDAIAVIPELDEKNGKAVARFINISGVAK